MINLKNIHLNFGDRKIFDGFNLNVKEKEKILIYGKSGIGKSSILNLILGFVQPDKGEIYFKDDILNKNNIWNFRKKTAFVTQNNDLTGGKVREFILDVLNFKANKEIEMNEERLIELMKYFDLDSSFIDKEFQDLSGGEKQRISIIISIMMDKEIYLLDEITSSLDNKMKEKVVDYFIEKMDKTEIIISHDNHWIKKSGLKVINLEEM
jgi:putative ABC transport system ATP-binding protein